MAHSAKYLQHHYGLTKLQLADLMRNNMHIPTSALDALSVYYMKHCTGAEFARTLEEGTVEYNGKRYSVIYHGCLPFAAKRAHEIRLSFRAAKSDYEIEPPYVLVQMVEEKLV